MSELLQATSSPIASGHAADRTMLARTILLPSPHVQGTSMGGETVLLDLSAGRYYTLNRLGSVIWKHFSDMHAAPCHRIDVRPRASP